MKTMLKNVLYSLLRPCKYKGAIILMYHSVGENSEFFTVSEKEFDRQMKYVSENNFNVIRVTELIGMLENNVPIPSKTVAITFDDGYKDNFLNALPILKKYNFPATIFISTANIGGTTFARNGTELKMLSTSDITEMDKSGLIRFGSHAHSHGKLPSLNTTEIHEQFSSSKKILENMLGKDVDCIVYPSGKVTGEIEEMAKEYFRAGFGVQKGRVMHGDDVMALKRNSVDSEVSYMQFKGIAVFGRI